MNPLVLKIGGASLEPRDGQDALWDAILDLHAACGGLTIVHGGGKGVDAMLERLNMPTHRIQGLRVTPDDQMDVITGVLAGTTNKKAVGALNARATARGLRPLAIGLCLGDASIVQTRMTSRFDGALGRVGEVIGGSPLALSVLLGAGCLPVIACVGIDQQGGLLNVNADDAAAGLVRTINSQGLVLLTDVSGVRGSDGATIPSLTRDAAEALISSGVVSGGMIPKVRSAFDTADQILAPVRILGGTATQSAAALASLAHELRGVPVQAASGTACLPRTSPRACE